jgi:hypothetical protein
MRKKQVFIFFLFCTVIVFGQQKQDSLQKTGEATLIVPLKVNLVQPDSITIKAITTNQVNQSLFEKNMPWIVAFVIGLLSVFVNFWVANRLRQSNERNLQSQLKSSKETILLEFQATIASKNRQEWINELRQTLSEYLSSTSLIVLLPPNPIQKILDDNAMYTQRLSLSKAKLELLLNENKAEQKELLDEIEKMLNIVVNKPSENYTVEIRAARSKVILAARKLFEIHWNKIKDLK